MRNYPTCLDCKKQLTYGAKRCNPCFNQAKVIPIGIRFFKFVKKTPHCWIWKGPVRTWGYGQISTQKGVSVSAHRFSWEFHNGKIPKGLLVLHKCDNRLCVDPKHLFLGTQKQNIADCMRKKRWLAIGDTHPMARLSWKQVSKIRTQYIPYKVKAKYLAKKFHVSEATIRDIVNGKSWKHSI